MAMYDLTWQGVTFTATAFGANNLVDSTYPFFIRGGGSTQVINYQELYIAGEDAASTANEVVFGRSVTQVGSGTAGGTTAQLADAAATAPATTAVVGNTNATNKPQRTVAGQLLSPALNTFGGIVRWVVPNGVRVTTVGNAAGATGGEATLSTIVGGGKTSGHVIFEVV